MGGVDMADQLVKYYHMERTIKWYKKLFFHLLNIAVNNACIIYKQHTRSKISTLQFRLDLIDQLLHSAGVESECKGGVAGRPISSGSNIAQLNTNNHFPDFNPVSTTTNHVKARQCRVCNKTNKRVADG